MHITSHIVDRRPECPFRVAGKRYQAVPPRDSGYTVVLLHATGLHKETFEPVIESLLALSGPSGGDPIVREAWTVDCPNHGESAVLNEDVLQRDYADTWNGDLFARSLHIFLTSQPGGINLTNHKLAVGGHSIGGNAAVLLTALKPQIRLSSIILMDATIGATVTQEGDRMVMILTQVVWSKPDTWRTRDDARKWISAAPGYKTWDPRVLQLYVSHALRVHPASKFPPPYKFNGVSLACTKGYEAACYRAHSHHEEAFNRLQELYAQGTPPIHHIFSQKDEFNGAKLKEGLLKATRGGGAASVQWIENAGHMFVQQRPEATAKAIWQALVNTTSNDAKL